MGLFDTLGLSRKRLDALASPINLGASPFQSDSLVKVLLSELYEGTEAATAVPITRDLAIQVPAVAKARNVLVAAGSSLPLVALAGEDPIKDQPSWLYRTNGAVSPHERMANTLDDGFFHGLALWLTDRGAPVNDKPGPILNADYCPWGDWRIEDGKILVLESPVNESEIILFNFPTAGILVEGKRTIQGARDTESAWTGRMRNPIPLIELRVTDDTNLSQDEIDAYVKAWAAARKQENGAVSFTPPGIELHTHGDVSADLYIENRNAVRTDIGSFANIRASMLDGTAGIDSLTYTTVQGERNAFYDMDLPFWLDPIEARLSQDDITPRGTRIRFDKSEQYIATPTPTGAPVKD